MTGTDFLVEGGLCAAYVCAYACYFLSIGNSFEKLARSKWLTFVQIL